MFKALDDYIAYMTENKKSQNTISAYKTDIASFLENAAEQGISDISDISPEFIERYKQSLFEDGKTASSVSRKLSALRAFYKFVGGKEKIENPLLTIKNAKREEKEIEVLTPKEVELLLLQPDTSDIKGLRDRAMLETLYATGMRVSEAINLNVEDVNLKIEFVRCRNENHERTIPLYTIAAKTLSAYITKSRPKFCEKNRSETALFVNINGERMTRQGFWKILKHYVNEAGIKKDVTPHTLRHSFAAHLLENGANIKDIQEILGHTDISSMQMYSKYLKSKLRSTYIKHHPRA